MRIYSPWTAALAPGDGQLLMYNNLANLTGLLNAPLPPSAELPAPFFQSEIFMTSGPVRSSRSIDGKVMMYGIMFTLASE